MSTESKPPLGSAPAAPRTRRDVASTRAWLESLAKTSSVEAVIDSAVAVMALLCDKNNELTLRLERLRQEHSGRRSEKINPKQLALLLELAGQAQPADNEDAEDAEDDLDEELKAAEEEERKKRKRKKPRRRRAQGVNVEQVHHDLPPNERTCGICQREMPKIGEDVSQRIEFIPAQIVVREDHRAKYACPRCKCGVKTAPGPTELVPGGRLGTSVLSETVYRKYAQHQTLTRIADDLLQMGVAVPMSTLSDAVAAVASALRPVAELIGKRALESYLLQMDGSGLKVQAPGTDDGIKRGTMWCHVGDRKWVYFYYSPNATGLDGPWKILAERAGFLQADASGTFDRLFNGLIAGAIEVGCWAHARRKFHELIDSDPRVARALQLIGKLFKVERLADLRGYDARARQKFRVKRSTKYLAQLESWLAASVVAEPPASAFAKACAYAIRHWKALTRFLEDGQLPLSNNFCELQIRSLALGRKNYLFAGSDRAAEDTAVLYTVLRTCALHRVNIREYLNDVLRRVAEGWPTEQYAELLPDRWATARASPPTGPPTQAEAA